MPARSNFEWQRWGETDPLYGVATWDGKRADGSDPWTDDEFYAIGASDWRDFLAHWEQYGCKAGVCVEIGCGAGRLTRPMASYFDHVHGVDVSDGMLRKAGPAVDGLPVTLHLTDGLSLPLESESVDAAVSTHVFQHLDSEDDALANWREIERVLRPGGTLMVHIPVHVWPGGLSLLQAVHVGRRRLGDMRAELRRRRMARGTHPPIMRGHSYEWLSLEATLRRLGFTNVELRVFRVSINDGLHTVVLARKPDRSE